MSRAKSKVVMVLQSRMGSTRLPGKSMMNLAGAPLLGRILERVKRAKLLDTIVVATTQKTEDDVINELASRYGVSSFRGSEVDLVDRYYQAALEFNATHIVRLPADNATPEPSEIDRIIDFHLSHPEFEFSSNLAQVFGNGYPDGIGSEIFNFESLKYVWQHCKDVKNREHVHLNFFDYATQSEVDPQRFHVGTIECPKEFRRPDLVLDVNTQSQYEFISKLYKKLYPQNPNFHITDIINWYDNEYHKLDVQLEATF